MSDTHGHHRSVNTTETDILIHAGDISGINKKQGVVDFFKWFLEQSAKHKILVAGNHDALLRKNKIEIPDGIIYLNDSGIIIEGYNIWGSPFTPKFSSYSEEINSENEKFAQQSWGKIPLITDILITHAPPKGILDLGDDKIHKGCAVLFETLMRIKPSLHLFGHIHEANGKCKIDNTTFINASIVNVQEEPINDPYVIEI